eukprot:4966544-Amphidinium_carterae.1
MARHTATATICHADGTLPSAVQAVVHAAAADLKGLRTVRQTWNPHNDEDKDCQHRLSDFACYVAGILNGRRLLLA